MSGASERAIERTSEWPSTYVPIIGLSKPPCYASLVTLFQLHREKPLEEAILLFLTGQEEIESVVGSAKALVNDPTNG